MSAIFADCRMIISRHSLAIKQHCDFPIIVKYKQINRNLRFIRTDMSHRGRITKRMNKDSHVAKCRYKKVCESRLKRKFTAIIAHLSAGFAVSAYTICVRANEHRYACISIKGKYDERKTGHVAAVFRTCRAHNASNRFLSMWRKRRRSQRPRNAIIILSSRFSYNSILCTSMTLRIVARVLLPRDMLFLWNEKNLSVILTFYRVIHKKRLSSKN